MSRLKNLKQTACSAWASMKDKTEGASYTVMVAPDDTSRMVKLCLPKKWVRRTVYGVGGFFVLFLALSVDYALVKAKASEVERLRRETRQQKQELASLTRSMSEVVAQMDKLREFDAKLRVMTNLEGGRSPGEASPEAAATPDKGISVGGENPEVLNPLREELSTQDEALLANLSTSLNRIKSESEAQEQSFAELIDSLADQKTLLASTPSVWPVKGWLTSSFGSRISPFTGTREFHKGLDIATRSGTPVVAPADGTVVYVAREGGWGLTVILDHGYGVRTQYGHLESTDARVGRRVHRGETIGKVGNTGRSTGPHLHYEVMANGASVNPMRYILN